MTERNGIDRVDAIITNVIDWTRSEPDSGYPCSEVQSVADDLDALAAAREAAEQEHMPHLFQKLRSMGLHDLADRLAVTLTALDGKRDGGT